MKFSKRYMPSPSACQHISDACHSNFSKEGTRVLINCVLWPQDYSNLTKADIFALALTVLSASGAEPLPTNGDKWHEIRQGKISAIPQVLSAEFLELLKVAGSSHITIYLLYISYDTCTQDGKWDLVLCRCFMFIFTLCV